MSELIEAWRNPQALGRAAPEGAKDSDLRSCEGAKMARTEADIGFDIDTRRSSMACRMFLSFRYVYSQLQQIAVLYAENGVAD